MNIQSKNAIDMLLAESFQELVAAKPIEKITIREITDRAGVIRPTFYNHFQDKYELLEWIAKKELIEPIIPLINNHMLKEAITYVLKTMQSGKSFYLKAVGLEGQNSFAEVLKDAIRDLILSQVNEQQLRKLSPYSWLTPEYAADIYAENLCYIVVRWSKEGMQTPTDELAAMILFTLTHSALDITKMIRE